MITQTASEAAILTWARAEIARLEASPDSDVVAVLLIGHPGAMEMITHELEDHCPGLGTVDERVFLRGDTHLALYTNRLL